MNLEEIKEMEVFRIFAIEKRITNIFININSFTTLPNYYGYTKNDGKHIIFYNDKNMNTEVLFQSKNQLDAFFFFASSFGFNYMTEREKIINKEEIGFSTNNLYMGRLGRCIKVPDIEDWPYLFVDKEIDPYIVFIKLNESIEQLEEAVNVLNGKKYYIFKGYLDNSALDKVVGREVIFGPDIEEICDIEGHICDKYWNVPASNLNDILTKKNEESNKKVMRRIKK